MNLDELYHDVAEWQKETFKGADAYGAAEHLRREASEVHQLLWHSDAHNLIRRPVVDVLDLGEEMADVFFMLVQLATTAKIDLPCFVQAKLEKNKRRTWKAPDSRGVVEHE